MTCHLTYTINGLPDARMQAVSSADRKACALTHALNAALNQRRLGGLLPSTGTITQACLDELHTHNVPESRARLWSAGLDLIRPNGSVCETFAGRTLDPYQSDALRRLTCAGGILALGCGLGKTLTALCAVEYYQSQLATKRLWIICPLNAMSSWKPYVSFMDGWDVKIISMDSLHKLAAAPVGGVIIYDEAHLLGASTARRTKAAHTTRIAFDVGLCLTGTFLHGGVEKTLSMLDLAIPGAAGFASKWSAGEYFKCLVRKKIGTRSVTEIVRPGGVQRERLFQYLARYVVMLSSSSDSVRASLTVPDQHIHTIQLAEPWRSLHEEASHVALTEYDATGVLPNAQATAHALCRAGADAKIAWIFEHLDNEACVIYAHYHETLDAVQAELEAAGITYVRVDGSTTAKERIEARDRFADGTAQVFLGQVVASGIGVDGLQERAIYSISLDHSWRPDVYSQSLARTCRRGQTQETHHFDLVANRLQLHVLNRIRAGEQFNAECQEWQELRTITQDLARNTSPDPTLTPPCPATGQGSTEP